MKTTREILWEKPVYLHNWAESKKFGLVANFEGLYISKADYDATTSPYSNEEAWQNKKARMKQALADFIDVQVLFASYGEDNWSGDAWVLFGQKGKLYEVNGSHCSCFGLEGQWKPEPVVLRELEQRLKSGHFGRDSYSDNEFADNLATFLGITLQPTDD